MENKTKIITFANAKGGCGKTTTTSNFAYCLVERGKKVLCIDLDFQSNLSLTLGCEDYDQKRFSISELISDTYRNVLLPEKKEYIVHCLNGIDLIPCNSMFTRNESIFSSLNGEFLLKKFFEKSDIINEYDFILLDTHPNDPNQNPTVKAALYTSDALIIPISPSEFDEQGVIKFIRMIVEFMNSANDNVNINFLGLIPTRIKKNEFMSKEILDFCKMTEEITFTAIPNSTGVGQAQKIHSVICKEDPKNIAAKAYNKFTDEYLDILTKKG